MCWRADFECPSGEQYMLWEGNADVSSAGVEEVLHSYGQGDYFGELALLSTKGALHSPETRSQHVSLRMLGASVLSWSFLGWGGRRAARRHDHCNRRALRRPEGNTLPPAFKSRLPPAGADRLSSGANTLPLPCVFPPPFVTRAVPVLAVVLRSPPACPHRRQRRRSWRPSRAFRSSQTSRPPRSSRLR